MVVLLVVRYISNRPPGWMASTLFSDASPRAWMLLTRLNRLAPPRAAPPQESRSLTAARRLKKSLDFSQTELCGGLQFVTPTSPFAFGPKKPTQKHNTE